MSGITLRILSLALACRVASAIFTQDDVGEAIEANSNEAQWPQITGIAPPEHRPEGRAAHGAVKVYGQQLPTKNQVRKAYAKQGLKNYKLASTLERFQGRTKSKVEDQGYRMLRKLKEKGAVLPPMRDIPSGNFAMHRGKNLGNLLEEVQTRTDAKHAADAEHQAQTQSAAAKGMEDIRARQASKHNLRLDLVKQMQHLRKTVKPNEKEFHLKNLESRVKEMRKELNDHNGKPPSERPQVLAQEDLEQLSSDAHIKPAEEPKESREPAMQMIEGEFNQGEESDGQFPEADAQQRPPAELQEKAMLLRAHNDDLAKAEERSKVKVIEASSVDDLWDAPEPVLPEEVPFGDDVTPTE